VTKKRLRITVEQNRDKALFVSLSLSLSLSIALVRAVCAAEHYLKSVSLNLCCIVLIPQISLNSSSSLADLIGPQVTSRSLFGRLSFFVGLDSLSQ
jgi:hypothetical protein